MGKSKSLENIEINGNLNQEGYDNFSKISSFVFCKFCDLFGFDVMTKIDLYIDNATAGSGYTPIITPVLKKLLVIKLNIPYFNDSEKIIYQLSHELCHYVFYSKLGINKAHADYEEEKLCSAISFCMVHETYINSGLLEQKYIKTIDNQAYSDGYYLAEKINFDIEEMKKLINNYIDMIKKVI